MLPESIPIWRLVLLLLLLGAASCSTCAARQRVSIDSSPRDASVFIDGELAGTPPLDVDLRADRDHSVFLKRDGYRPELIILRTREEEKRHRLEPPEVRGRLVPLDRGRDLEVEVDKAPPPDSVPLDPSWQRRP